MAIEDILHDALDREHDNQRALCAPNEVAELRAEQVAERRALTSALNEAGNAGRAALETAIEALGFSGYGREDALREAHERNAALTRHRDEARAVAVRQQERLTQAARAINSHTPHAPDGPVLPWEASERIEAAAQRPPAQACEDALRVVHKRNAALVRERLAAHKPLGY